MRTMCLTYKSVKRKKYEKRSWSLMKCQYFWPDSRQNLLLVEGWGKLWPAWSLYPKGTIVARGTVVTMEKDSCGKEWEDSCDPERQHTPRWCRWGDHTAALKFIIGRQGREEEWYPQWSSPYTQHTPGTEGQWQTILNLSEIQSI